MSHVVSNSESAGSLNPAQRLPLVYLQECILWHNGLSALDKMVVQAAEQHTSEVSDIKPRGRLKRWNRFRMTRFQAIQARDSLLGRDWFPQSSGWHYAPQVPPGPAGLFSNG